MKISPDGSLPRITSSSKGLVRYVQIIKVPDDEVKEDGLPYKLAWIGPVESQCDSEKSEEEPWSDDDIPSVQLPVEKVPNNQILLKNKEKAKDVESQTESKTRINKPENVHYAKRYKNNRYNKYRGPPKQGNYNSSKRNFNTSNRLHTKYDNGNTSLSNVEENSYKYFSNKKEFISPGNFGRNYSTPRDLDSISPWMETSDIVMNTKTVLPYPVSTAYTYPPAIEQIPPNHNADNNNYKAGILGDYPLNYPCVPPNISNQEYWNNAEYHEYSPKGYQRIPNRGHVSMPGRSGYKNHYQRNHWQRKNRKNNWNKKRMNTSGHYQY